MFNSEELQQVRCELASLRAELSALKEDVVRCRNIRVYDTGPESYVIYGNATRVLLPTACVDIMHGEAIQKLAAHIGVEFKYQAGRGAEVALGKATAKGTAKSK